MNDKRKSLFFPADPKSSDSHAENELYLLKEKLKRRQNPNLDDQSASSHESDGKVATQPRTEAPDPINDNLLADIRRSLAEDENLNQGTKKRGGGWSDKLKDLTRGLTVLDKILLTIIAVLLIATGMTGLGIKIINAQTSERSSAPVTVTPYPVRITLPGGWDFKLAAGQVVNGKWSPEGAEWLESTELCKWIAIPWTAQLEAVIRTLQPNDEIQLIMSNADMLEFKVLSIENVSADQIGGLDRVTPSLLLILVNKNVDTRWVLTALSE